MKTLKEVIEFLDDGLDIGDDTFDFGNYYGYDLKLNDYYDKVLDFMASKIEFVKYQKDWYSTCKITEFIEKYQNQFDEFLNQAYKEKFTPKYICEQEGLEKIDSDDELFFDIYFSMFSDLINGNFSKKNYEKLYNIFIKGDR